MSTTPVTTRRFSSIVNAGEADSRRWLILATICFAALMIVLDVTVMNLALPSAQRALGFTNADRQWIVTAYSLSFGSLLLFGGRLADLIGRKVTFLTGLAGFAGASAVGGASVSFTMLVTVSLRFARKTGPVSGQELASGNSCDSMMPSSSARP